MESNIAQLCGIVISELKFSHKTYGEIFYTFVLGVERRSGYVDEINIMVSERLIYDNPPQMNQCMEIKGQVRTYNEIVEGRNKLNVVVFAKEIYLCEDFGYHENYIYLEGFLCKTPIKRTSPLGRDICDMMLAVNRMYNKSDYIPCIAWGRNAGYGEQLSVGTKLMVEGRLQSREYKKKLPDGSVEMRKAFEVSLLKLEEAAFSDEASEE